MKERIRGMKSNNAVLSVKRRGRTEIVKVWEKEADQSDWTGDSPSQFAAVPPMRVVIGWVLLRYWNRQTFAIDPDAQILPVHDLYRTAGLLLSILLLLCRWAGHGNQWPSIACAVLSFLGKAAMNDPWSIRGQPFSGESIFWICLQI